MSFLTMTIDLSPLRTSRQFVRLYLTRLCGFFAGGMAGASLFMQVHKLTDSTIAVGLIGFIFTVAVIGGLLAGGYLADRFDKRFLIAGAGVFSSLLMAALAFNASAENPSVAVLFLIAVCGGGAQGLSAPASTAAATLLVAPHQLAATGALNAAAVRIGGVVCPAVSGVLAARYGFAAPFGAGAMIALMGGGIALLLSEMPVATPREQGYRASMTEALSFVRRSPVISAVLAIDLMAVLFATPFSLIPELADRSFSGGTEVAGFLYSAPALGALMASLFSGWTAWVSRPGLWLLLAAITWPAAIAAFGLSPSVSAAAASLVVAGFADAISEILRTALVQQNTPRHLLGRVNSLWLAQAFISPAFGNMNAAIASRFLGPAAAIAAGGATGMLATTAAAWGFPVLRRCRNAN